LADVLGELFGRRGAEIVEGNQLVAKAGFDRVQGLLPRGRNLQDRNIPLSGFCSAAMMPCP